MKAGLRPRPRVWSEGLCCFPSPSFHDSLPALAWDQQGSHRFASLDVALWTGQWATVVRSLPDGMGLALTLCFHDF